jgi:hypothetical protein
MLPGPPASAGPARELVHALNSDRAIRRVEAIRSSHAGAEEAAASNPAHASTKQNKYAEASIRVLSGLEPVKQRPGMYTRTDRPLHIVQEVIDNAADEALAGFGQRIAVVLHADGSITWPTAGTGERQVFGIPSCTSPRRRVDLRQRRCALEGFGHFCSC